MEVQTSHYQLIQGLLNFQATARQSGFSAAFPEIGALGRAWFKATSTPLEPDIS